MQDEILTLSTSTPGQPTTAKVPAAVNWGRWVWRCAVPRCGFVGLAPRDQSQTVLCKNCDQWYLVEWPDPEFTASLEALLLSAPGFRDKKAALRCWEPHQTLNDLENRLARS